MSKWKCGICNSEFENYQAQGFNRVIYCPLCYFKELYKREKNENQQLKKQKDDVVKDIKKQITFCTNEAEGTVNNDKCWMAVNYLKKLLRMLGESDE